MNDQIIWQQYIQQVESLSPENKVSKFCEEAGFMRVVEVGQYFVTKDTGNFRQFRSVACREYTLPRDDSASQPKGWIQGNMRIGLVLEITTGFQNYKYGIEIRIWSVGQDNSHYWVPMERSNMWSITTYMYGKHGIEVRIWSLRKDNSQSWVRIFSWSKEICLQQHGISCRST